MKKTLFLVFIIAIVAYSIVAVISEVQPALFWITVFAPNVGDTYPIVLVGLLTFITMLLPVFIIALSIKIVRKKFEKPQITDGPGAWIIRKKQLQSRLLEIPIFINDKKIGGIDSGKIKFFKGGVGKNTVQAGTGKNASEKLEFICEDESKQPYFKLEIVESGFLVKFVLHQITAADIAFSN